MQPNKTVTISGRIYDAVTGLPLEKAPKDAPKPVSPATVKKRAAEVAAASVHAQPQKSKTLYRRVNKKPATHHDVKPAAKAPAQKTAAAPVRTTTAKITKRTAGPRHMDISRSASVSKFAPHPVAAAVKKEAETPDAAPKAHPVAARADARVSAPKAVTRSKTSKQIKDEAIATAIAAPEQKAPKKKRGFHWSRKFTIISAVFAVLIIGAYLTWANIPSISVGYAAARAGISATYPQYKPDGYRLKQPVTYSDGSVKLVFKSNSSDSQYAITQNRSSWDSSAVLNNVVKKAAGDNYVTTQESGLTIYSYDDMATWVNGGILYAIDSNAPLSGEQIRHIATSL